MWLLFVPIVLIIVLLMMVASLFAGMAWLIGAGWPWLLIGLGIWLFWHEDGRHRSRHVRGGRRDVRRWASDRDAAPDRRAAQSRPVAQPSSQPRPLQHSELPIDVQVKVEQIRRKVDVLLGYADRFPPFSQDLYLVRQTASEYLPRTISAYLALPKQTADTPLVAANGKTGRQEIKAQLDLLDSKLDDIAGDLQRQDADRLLANRRFLEARFGTRDAPLSVKSSAGAEVA